MAVIYRKMQNGREFMKIIDSRHAMSVMIGGPVRTISGAKILWTDNKMIIHDYMDDHVSMPSSEKEFSDAYKLTCKKLKDFFLYKIKPSTMSKKKETRKVNRSAETGKFVTRKYAEKNKATTVRQTVRKGGKK